jgi:hypothetical protein
MWSPTGKPELEVEVKFEYKCGKMKIKGVRKNGNGIRQRDELLLS